MEGVWTPSIAMRTEGNYGCKQRESKRGGKGDGGVFFFGETTRAGGGGYSPAEFRRDCPPDVPLRFGTGHGERGDKRQREESVRVGGGKERERPCLTPSPLEMLFSPYSSLFLQSGFLLNPQGRLSASLHTNSPLPHSLEQEQRTESD